MRSLEQMDAYSEAIMEYLLERDFFMKDNKHVIAVAIDCTLPIPIATISYKDDDGNKTRKHVSWEEVKPTLHGIEI